MVKTLLEPCHLLFEEGTHAANEPALASIAVVLPVQIAARARPDIRLCNPVEQLALVLPDRPPGRERNTCVRCPCTDTIAARLQDDMLVLHLVE